MDWSVRILTAFCISILALSLASLACAQGFTVVTNNVPPIKYVEKGELQGVTAEVLKELTNRTGYTVNKTVRELTLQQAYDEVRNTPGTLLPALVRTPQREPDFKWVGPVYTTRAGLIAKKKHNIKLVNLADAKKYVIGTIINSGPERSLIKRGFPVEKMVRCNGTAEIIQAIKADKVDMISFAITPSFYIMLQAGIDPKDYELLKEINSLDLYIAFNRETSDDVIKSFQMTLIEMKKPGKDGSSKYDRIVSKYFFPGI